MIYPPPDYIERRIEQMHQQQQADESLLRQALEALEHEAQTGNDDAYRPLRDSIKERLK
jgi:hypothetical protein